VKAFCTIAALFLLSLSAWAQTGVGVSPPRQMLTAEPGATVKGMVVVDHPGSDAPMKVKVSLSDVIVQPDGNLMYLAPGSIPQSAAKWLTIPEVSFPLMPKESHELRYSLAIPQSAKPGTYWAVIFFESGPLQEASEKGIGVKMRVRVGHVVYVNVGEVTQKGNIEGIRYQPAAAKTHPQLRVKFNNTGNGLMRLSGFVELKDSNGKTVAKGTIHNAASLPGYNYEISADLEKAPPSGDYVALIKLDYGGNQVIVGEGKVRIP